MLKLACGLSVKKRRRRQLLPITLELFAKDSVKTAEAPWLCASEFVECAAVLHTTCDTDNKIKFCRILICIELTLCEEIWQIHSIGSHYSAKWSRKREASHFLLLCFFFFIELYLCIFAGGNLSTTLPGFAQC